MKSYDFEIESQMIVSVKNKELLIDIKNDNISRFNKALTPVYSSESLINQVKSVNLKLNTVIVLNEMLSEFQELDMYPFQNVEKMRFYISYNFDKSKQIDDALWIGMLQRCFKLKQLDFLIDMQVNFSYKEQQIQCTVEDQHQINFGMNKLLYPISTIPSV